MIGYKGRRELIVIKGGMMKRLLIFLFVLGGMILVGCDAVSIVPRAQPTQTPLPTRAPPSPTVPPTATQPPPTATTNPAANPLDALRSAFASWAVRNPCAKMVQTKGTTTTLEGTLEAVPDRFHMVTKQIEMIAIGKTFYMKTGTTWQKVTLTQGLDFSFADIKKWQDELGVATETKFIGADVLDGAPMLVYEYKTTVKGPPAITSTTKVWLAVSDRLPRKTETISTSGAKTVMNFYDFNANVAIEAPIK
jgi:hypothetical protein